MTVCDWPAKCRAPARRAREMVREVIRRDFGYRPERVSAGRPLRKLGGSRPQRMCIFPAPGQAYIIKLILMIRR